MNITAKDIAAIRTKTGLPMMEIKSALIEAGGNEERAMEILRKKGLSKSEKRAGKKTNSGVVDSYVHAGRIGVLVEVLCETDFVAKNEDFKNFAHEISLQVAATAPSYVEKDKIPTEVLEKEKKLFVEEAKNSGKPENVIEKIVQGRLETYYSEVALLSQPYFRDPKKTVSDLLNEIIAKTGEKIIVSRFARIELSC
ncbi:MAG TPA: translation elongation factor Ts [bacterium]|jgi:elongation factor Ts|nr:translation elongation factor Ts [bacterium]